uniref:Alkyl transferase n=1 Tax=Trichuris muris TaxID=70415 RepID=A0A5S6R453_TRIMR
MNSKDSMLFVKSELTWWQRLLTKLLQMGPIPKHVAFIMDGNRRYARRRGVPSELGHEFGFEALAMALQWCNQVGIREVTAFAFSIENFKRSESEVAMLMSIARRKFADLILELGVLMENGVCVRFFGNTSLLPLDIQKLMADLYLRTRHNNKLFLNVCVAYNSRDEFTRAVKSIENAVRTKNLETEDISECLVRRVLDSGDSSNPDLVIRTSGETRLSDFMMIQISNSFLYFDDVLWPEYSFWNLFRAILAFQRSYDPVVDKQHNAARSTFADSSEKSDRVDAFLESIRHQRFAMAGDLVSKSS